MKAEMPCRSDTLNPDNDLDPLAQARRHMIEFDLKGRDIHDPRVLKAMAQVKRELFVPPEYQAHAYDDRPLPIGMEQTISQPYIVALMTQVLAVERDCTVLEIGTGSGYQTAILALLAKKVFSIERIEALSVAANKVIKRLGIQNVHLIVADGSLGWPGPLQFHRIMVTAAVQEVPPPLIAQLKVDGLLVAPVGSSNLQTLVLLRKTDDGLVERPICPVRFVRLIGRHGFQY